MRSKSLLLLPALLATFLLAAAPAQDQAGSSEAETVERSCGAEHDTRYDPPSGEGLAECQDADGNHDPTLTYEATHWTNDVSCGTEDQTAPTHDATGVAVSADGGQEGTGGGGYIQVCSDGDLPIQGRITLEGAASDGGLDGTATADGDKDNQPEQAQGWAQADVGDGTVECGKAYEEGGRSDASHQAEGDGGQEHCG